MDEKNICNRYIIRIGKKRVFQGRSISKSFGTDKKILIRDVVAQRPLKSCRNKNVDIYFFPRAMPTFRGKARKTGASPEQAKCNDCLLYTSDAADE